MWTVRGPTRRRRRREQAPLQVANGGASLYRSFPVTYLAGAPYAMIMMASNESLRLALRRRGGSDGLDAVVASGAAAGAVAGFATAPLDALKTRLQARGARVEIQWLCSDGRSFGLRLRRRRV